MIDEDPRAPSDAEGDHGIDEEIFDEDPATQEGPSENDALSEMVREDDDEEAAHTDLVPPLSPEIADALEDLSPETAREVSLAFYASSSGPMPPPGWVDAYEQTMQGAADRIFGMAEREQQHRHNMDMMVVGGEIRGDNMTRLVGAGLATIVLVGAIVLIGIGKSVEGLIALVPAVVGLLALFFASQNDSAPPPNGDPHPLGPGGDDPEDE